MLEVISDWSNSCQLLDMTSWKVVLSLYADQDQKECRLCAKSTQMR